MTSKDCHVVAGLISDQKNRVLIAQRQPGTHMAGAWEFPGGKLEAGENRLAGLQRELKEELNITVRAASPLIQLRYRYPDRNILLDFWCIDAYDGIPLGAEGQALHWVHKDALDDADILVADQPAITAFLLPDRYSYAPRPDADLTRFSRHISAASANNISLLQIRAAEDDPDRLRSLVEVALTAAPDCRLLLYGDPKITIPLAQATAAAGIHLPARFLAEIDQPIADYLLVAASCRDATELALAVRAGASFAVLGPVSESTRHPGRSGMGWGKFSERVAAAMLPVYASGGLGLANIAEAKSLGAQGVAGSSEFFPSD